MKTPYEILKVATDATDVEIKQAYLQSVKDNPPDREQVQFQLIHQAYSAIKNHRCRVHYALFDVPVPDFDALLVRAFSTTQSLQLQADDFAELLQVSRD